jgi:Outer membrane protein beta-barrel domain
MDENLPEKIDRVFNDALQNYNVRPAEEIWIKIEDKLDADDRKPGWIYFRWRQFAAIILLIGAGALIKIYFQPGSEIIRKSTLPEKPEISSQIDPKANLRGNNPQSETNLFSKDWNKKESLPVANTGITVKKSGLYQEMAAQGFCIENKEIASSAFLLTIPPVESRVTHPRITEPAFPSESTMDAGITTLIHQKSRFKDRFSITPYFSKEFAGYSLTDNDQTGANGQEIEQRERNVFSASVGFYLNYKFSKKWILQSGISYSWSNSNIDSATSYAVKDNQGKVPFKLNTISGYGYLYSASAAQPSVGDSIYTAKSYSQLHYLTVPLILSYRIPLKRFSLLVGAGATFNILTSAELETKTYGNGYPETEYTISMKGLKKVNYGVLVKLDLEYHLNSNLGIDIMPCFKNTLSPMNLETPVSAYPYNVGVGVGLTYRF